MLAPADGGRHLASNSVIAGAGSGLVTSFTTCPLDVIKIKLQAQRTIVGQAGYLGVGDTVRKILREDGIRGFYRGLGPTIIGYLPAWAIYFVVYDGIKTYFGQPPLGATSPATYPSAASHVPSFGQSHTREKVYPAAQVPGYHYILRDHPWSLNILSAMVAGAANTICTYPLWFIRTRLMTQSRNEVRYRHTLHAAVTIFKSEGLLAFYRGLLPSLLGILHVTVQFPLYEQLKTWEQLGSSEPLSSHKILFCSTIAKMTASVVTYPHEVIRTRLQTERRLLSDVSSDGMIRPLRGIVYTTKKLVLREGWTGLYKGLSVNLLRTVPNSGVTMLTYELLMRRLSYYRP